MSTLMFKRAFINGGRAHIRADSESGSNGPKIARARLVWAVGPVDALSYHGSEFRGIIDWSAEVPPADMLPHQVFFSPLFLEGDIFHESFWCCEGKDFFSTFPKYLKSWYMEVFFFAVR